MIDLDHLANLARDATPGPRKIIHGTIWTVDGNACIVHAYATAECPRAGDYYGCINVRAEAHLRIRDADRDFIAALSPDVALELIEAARKGAGP